MVLEHDGQPCLVFDLIQFQEGSLNSENICSRILPHELIHLCLREDYPAPQNMSYIEDLNYTAFNEGFAHALPYPENFLSESLEGKVNRIIIEYRKKELLRKNGLKNRSKIMLTGNPGTGKTMTASVLANELAPSLYVVRVEKLITKYMGETSVKLRQVFDYIEEI